jgi:sarcosine oxidase subunit gamma
LARTPGAGLLPVEIGGVALREVSYGAITSVAPFRGGPAVDLALPEIGRFQDTEAGRISWAELGGYLVLGPRLAPMAGAAVVDQSDAWAVLALEGAEAAAVLARLTPLDLRDAVFGPGQAARSLLGHMTCLFLRTGGTRFEMLVFRSMAGTAVHEITQAMRGVAARAAL